MVLEIAPQRVQAPPRSIHVVWSLGPVQLKELKRQFGGMRRQNSSLASGREESLDATMPEALDHAYSVALHFPLVKSEALAAGCAILRIFWRSAGHPILRFFLLSHRCFRPAAHENVAPASRPAVAWTSRSTLVAFQRSAESKNLKRADSEQMAPPQVVHSISPARRTIIHRSFWRSRLAKSRHKRSNPRVTPYSGLFCRELLCFHDFAAQPHLQAYENKGLVSKIGVGVSDAPALPSYQNQRAAMPPSFAFF